MRSNFSINSQKTKKYLKNDTKKKESILLLACKIGNPEIVSILLEDPEIDPNLGNASRPTPPLQEACYRGNLEIVCKLLEHPRIDVNYGIPLYGACRSGNVDVVNRLLSTPNVSVNLGVVIFFLLHLNGRQFLSCI